MSKRLVKLGMYWGVNTRGRVNKRGRVAMFSDRIRDQTLLECQDNCIFDDERFDDIVEYFKKLAKDQMTECC